MAGNGIYEPASPLVLPGKIGVMSLGSSGLGPKLPNSQSRLTPLHNASAVTGANKNGLPVPCGNWRRGNTCASLMLVGHNILYALGKRKPRPPEQHPYISGRSRTKLVSTAGPEGRKTIRDDLIRKNMWNGYGNLLLYRPTPRCHRTWVPLVLIAPISCKGLHLNSGSRMI